MAPRRCGVRSATGRQSDRQGAKGVRCTVFAERVWSALILDEHDEPLEAVHALSRGEADELAGFQRRIHPQHRVELFSLSHGPRLAVPGQSLFLAGEANGRKALPRPATFTQAVKG